MPYSVPQILAEKQHDRGQSIDSEENGVDRNTTLVVLGGRQADADIPTSEIGKYAEVYAWNKYSRTNRAYRKGYGDVFMS